MEHLPLDTLLPKDEAVDITPKGSTLLAGIIIFIAVAMVAILIHSIGEEYWQWY